MVTLLFLGGFLALAFLFGSDARAATALDGGKGESPGQSADLLTPEKPVGGSLSEKEMAEKQQEAKEAADEAASHVIDPVAEGAEGAGHVTRPVGEAVGGVSDAVGLGDLTDRLGLQLGNGGGDGTPEDDGDDEAVNGGGGSSAGDADHASSDAGRKLAQRTPIGGSAADSAHSAVRHAEAHDGMPREGDGLPVQSPFQQVPLAPSAGASHFASDGNGPRGGLQKLAGHLTDVELFGRPQPGAVSVAAGAPTRDRASEVLEFPG